MLRSLHLVDRSRIAHDLAELGVSPGDTIMLHASVGEIGWIVGGPEEVVGAVTDVLGERGTAMMLQSFDIASDACVERAHRIPAHMAGGTA